MCSQGWTSWIGWVIFGFIIGSHIHHSNRETGREMYYFQVGLAGTDGSVRMISEVAEEEREALEAKVVEKSTKPIVIETCILRATLSTLRTIFIYESEEYVHGMPIDKVVEEEVKDKELEASKDYTGLIPEVESPLSRVSIYFFFCK